MELNFRELPKKPDCLAITPGFRQKLKLPKKEKISAGQSLTWLMIIVLLGSGLRQISPSLTTNFCALLVKNCSSLILEKKVETSFSPNQASQGIKIAASPWTQAERLDEIITRKKIKVALIDSGLGGLSIMAEAASRLEQRKIYRHVNLVFFNALFSSEGGYNALPTREARLKMLDRVLASLEKKVQPDLILVACNTLSTLYPFTDFAQKTKIPVLEIITPGVNLIVERLRQEPEAVAIILATPVTIEEDTHRQLLLNQGLASKRLIPQACPELELFIEKNPEGEETALLISAFLNEAVAKIPQPWPPVILSLNCTHYGYSLILWERAAQENGLNFVLINPNSRLIDLWLKPDLRPRFSKTTLKVSCLSKVPIEEEKRQAIAPFLRKISPLTAEALLKYSFDPALF